MQATITRSGNPGPGATRRGRVPTRLAMLLLALVASGCAGLSRAPASSEASSRTALSWFVEGVVAEGRGAYDVAGQCYESAWEAGGRATALAIARARCRLYVGEARAAYEILYRAWEACPDDARLLSLLSELGVELAPAEEAIRLTRRLLLADPSRVRPAYHLERLLRAAGRGDELVGIFEQAAGAPGVSSYLRHRLEILRRGTTGP